jgi:molecular chaperone DnaJ
MAATSRDYYELLGVERTATEADVKRAFRRKARELHPDVSDAPDAQERFREVVEAYEVLSKSETRELYDRFGHAGLQGGGFRPTEFDFGSLTDLFSAFFGDDLFGVSPRARRSRGADVAAEVAIELAEAATGVHRDVPFDVVVGCSRCDGSGAEPGTGVVDCDGCGGTGRIQQVGRSVFGEFVRAQACPRCAGVGRIVEHPCETCDGSGRVVERRTLDVEIPPGIHDGQRIRLSGEGHMGSRGGPAGDVYVRVRVRPDPRFVREGDDVYSTLDLTMTEAALGTTRTVETLSGEAELTFAPGTQPGEVRVLSGRGMPVLQGYGRGDHRVLVNVVVPRHLSPEQRTLLEEFGRSTGAENYRADEGFFEKLKSAFR